MAVYRKTRLEKYSVERPAVAPFVIDDWTLAFRLGFTGKALWYLLNTRSARYKVYQIPKATGGKRTIHDPQPIMKLMLKQIRVRILLPLVRQLGPHVAAYQVGKSTKDAAALHLKDCPVCAEGDKPHTCALSLAGDVVTGRYMVERREAESCPACQPVPKHACTRRGVAVHMDLKDFFTSTRMSWVRNYLKEVAGYNHYAAGLIAQLLTVPIETVGRDGKRRTVTGVPQGSPASGDICNLVADWKIDQSIIKELTPLGWTYSRYADDLYFSHPKNLPADEVNAMIAQVTALVEKVEERGGRKVPTGYRVNRKKTRIQRPHRRKAILGIVVNQKLNVPHDQYRRMRSMIHNCIRHGFDSQAERAKKESGGQLIAYLEGRIAYMSMIAPERAAKLRTMLNFALQRREAKVIA